VADPKTERELDHLRKAVADRDRRIARLRAERATDLARANRLATYLRRLRDQANVAITTDHHIEDGDLEGAT
jgi:outer membrane protein assembly factor BamD (BamD/ComL family)